MVHSSKMLHVQEWLRKVPVTDKGIVFSFFKGFLDLVEAILARDGVEYQRFDGDIGGDAKAKALHDFQTGPAKVLLATIASGGVGLNVVQANHVLFADRWFNPTVHEQAADRTHRIGQTKECHIEYVDAQDTFDEVMKCLMDKKKANAKVVLADGTDLGAMKRDDVKWEQVAGELHRKMQSLRAQRMGLPDPHAAKAPRAGPEPPGMEGVETPNVRAQGDPDVEPWKQEGQHPKPGKRRPQFGMEHQSTPDLIKRESGHRAAPAPLVPNKYNGQGEGVPCGALATVCQWACEQCTYLNEARAYNCAVCTAMPDGAATPTTRRADSQADWAQQA
jgi:hypothetical protein